MTSRAERGGSFAGRGISESRCLCRGRSLPRIKKRKAVDLAVIDTRQEGLHHPVPALARGILLHRRHEILLTHAGKVWYSRFPADAALAVAAGAGDRLAARAALVGANCVGEILRILARKARPPRRRDADTEFAVTAGAQGGGGPAGGDVTYRRSFRPVGRLSRIIGRDIVDFRLSQTGEYQPHQVVPALAGHVSPHRLREILRVLSDEAWYSSPFGDAAFAVTGRTSDRLNMRRAWAVAVLAIEFCRLGFADPPHQGPAERLGLDRMTVQTGLRTHSMRVGKGWIPSCGRWHRPPRAGVRCCVGNGSWLRLLSKHLAQGVKRVVRFRQPDRRIRRLGRISCYLLSVVTQRSQLWIVEIAADMRTQFRVRSLSGCRSRRKGGGDLYAANLRVNPARVALRCIGRLSHPDFGSVFA